jgi:hypothetical protein
LEVGFWRAAAGEPCRHVWVMRISTVGRGMMHRECVNMSVMIDTGG